MIPLLVVLAVAPEVPVLRAVSEPTEEFCVECCSLYCAASPSLRVSRYLPLQQSNRYDASVLEDGKGATAWVVKGGPGEWFEFVFEPEGFHPDVPVDNKRTGVNALYLWNGYNKSGARWREHARAHELQLSVNGEAVAAVVLLDDSRPQRVDLPPTLLRRGMRFRFTVTSVYAGDRYNELAISEVRLDGYGHH
jgi:hypothetical protein